MHRKEFFPYVFLILLSVTYVLFVVSSAISGGYALDAIVYYNFTDSFMDFFSVQDAVMSGNPYEKYYAIYPPLAYLIYEFLSLFIYRSNDHYLHNGIDVSYDFLFVFILYNIITVVLLSLLIYGKKKGNSPLKIWFTLLVILSYPFIYAYERGNIVIISFIFALLFFLGYNNDRKWVRELSYLSLAAAAGIKIYPAIFGLLILKEKRYREALHCIIYGVLIFFLPCFYYGGPGIFIKLIENISVNAALAFRSDIFACIDIFPLSMGCGHVDSPVLRYGLYAVILIILVYCVFKSKSTWKSMLALTFLAVSSPSFSFHYSLVFFALPLIVFLDSDEKRELMDYIYMILFIIIFAPIGIKDLVLELPQDTSFVLTINSYLTTAAVAIMLFLLCIETALAPLSKVNLSKKRKKADTSV